MVEKQEIIAQLKKLPPLRFRFIGGTPTSWIYTLYH